MKLQIARALRPYCHDAGTVCLIPFSAWKLTAYPTKIALEHMIDSISLEMGLCLHGPINDFTVQQDLSLGSVKIFGQAKEGYFRYLLQQHEEGLCLYLEKLPEAGITICYAGLCETVTAPRKIVLHKKRETEFSISLERLCLGAHKAQDCSAMRRRADMAEILPFWLRLGHIVPHSGYQPSHKGLIALLEECKERIAQKDRASVLEPLRSLFLAGFSGMLVPRASDDDHQGIIEHQDEPSIQPLSLLTEGASVIRSLFFQQKDGVIYLLPCLPSQFHSGRLLGLKTESGERIDIEWSKKQIRRVVIYVGSSHEIRLALQKDIRQFRLRKELKSKGVTLSATTPIACQPADILYLDSFQK